MLESVYKCVCKNCNEVCHFFLPIFFKNVEACEMKKTPFKELAICSTFQSIDVPISVDSGGVTV